MSKEIKPVKKIVVKTEISGELAEKFQAHCLDRVEKMAVIAREIIHNHYLKK